jgi:hypothetical protein
VLAGHRAHAHDTHDEKQDEEDDSDNQDWHTKPPGTIDCAPKAHTGL